MFIKRENEHNQCSNKQMIKNPYKRLHSWEKNMELLTDLDMEISNLDILNERKTILSSHVQSINH